MVYSKSKEQLEHSITLGHCHSCFHWYNMRCPHPALLVGNDVHSNVDHVSCHVAASITVDMYRNTFCCSAAVLRQNQCEL